MFTSFDVHIGGLKDKCAFSNRVGGGSRKSENTVKYEHILVNMSGHMLFTTENT